MKIRVVKYERLKKREEAFENERVGVEIALEDDDDPQAAMAAARSFVNRQLGEGLTVDQAQKQIDALVDAGVSRDIIKNVADELEKQVIDQSDRYAIGVNLHERVKRRRLVQSDDE